MTEPNHLNRLAMQRETPFGRFLQSISSWPLRATDAGCFVRLHTRVPYVRCFHLGRLTTLELPGRQVIQLVDVHRFHCCICCSNYGIRSGCRCGRHVLAVTNCRWSGRYGSRAAERRMSRCYNRALVCGQNLNRLRTLTSHASWVRFQAGTSRCFSHHRNRSP